MSDVRRTRGQQGETYTEYHPTIENSSSAKTAKSKSRPIQDKPKKKRAKGAVIAIIVIALLQFVPTLIAFVVDDLVPEIESSFGNSPAPDYDSDYSYAARAAGSRSDPRAVAGTPGQRTGSAFPPR